ncbi:hypothetical protein TcWFU_007497 [Taenia crassiceps]|uniref:Uncharacterized protein n=1 Tax=Taenia crassiceps TaxID=6207 RepID=A0ABR4QED8_9CEST
MNPNIKYLVVLPIILVFTCLAVALDINLCGSLFTKSCQQDEVYKQMTALLATALALFIIGTIFAFVSIFKSKSWICVSEFITVIAGGTLLLTTLCIYYQGKHFWAPLMLATLQSTQVYVVASKQVTVSLTLLSWISISRCQSWRTGREMTGLVAAALVAFVMASIFAALFILKKNRWSSICEFIALAAGAILMLAAVAVYYNRSSILSPLMAAITMTLSIEIAIFLLIDLVS